MVARLETARLVLRPFTPDDADSLVALDSDPDVMHFLTGGEPTPRERIVTGILPAFLAFEESGGPWGFWAAVEKSSGAFIGWFHLRPDRDDAGDDHSDPADDDPELGYRLVASVWGRGYATEGSRALIDRAFTEWGASMVYAETLAVHVASRRVMEKAGMTFERTFVSDWPYRIPGDEHGDVTYAITREQWLEQGRGLRPRTGRG